MWMKWMWAGCLLWAGIATAEIERETVADCSGAGLRVVVTQETESGTYYLRVTKARLPISSGRAERRQIADPTLTRVGYNNGSIHKGGADLRITQRHPLNPQVNGSAHISVYLEGSFQNRLLWCDTY